MLYAFQRGTCRANMLFLLSVIFQRLLLDNVGILINLNVDNAFIKPIHIDKLYALSNYSNTVCECIAPLLLLLYHIADC